MDYCNFTRNTSNELCSGLFSAIMFFYLSHLVSIHILIVQKVGEITVLIR